MIIDYSDSNLRNELIADIETFLGDYVRQQLDEQTSQSAITEEDYYNQLTSTLHYLRDSLIIQFK